VKWIEVLEERRKFVFTLNHLALSLPLFPALFTAELPLPRHQYLSIQHKQQNPVK
jgi:hypothetical protein